MKQKLIKNKTNKLMRDDNIINLIENKIQEIQDIGIQQRSAHYSSILSELQLLKTDIANLKDDVSNLKDFKKAGTYALSILVAVGALLTWLFNLFNIKIGIK